VGNRYGPFVLRLVLGCIFIAHGWPKLVGGTAGTAAFFAKVGVPFPLVMTIVVGGIELIGGALMILGLLTRVATVGLALVLVGAIVMVKVKMGLVGGYELDLALLAGLIALCDVGPGAFAVSRPRRS
jgi:putative oxidoreductase